MSITDLLVLLKPYGLAGVIVAILAGVIAVLYRQQMKTQSKMLTDAQDRAARLEAEVKALNADIQQYMLVGNIVRQTMAEAATEMRRLTDGPS
ncbi:MAG: hypothetical protein ACREQ5_00770 [Candidatus Dormibacteria bacterium]